MVTFSEDVQWFSALNDITRRHILFYYKTKEWKELTFKKVKELYTIEGKPFYSSWQTQASARKWRLITLDGACIECIPQTENEARGKKADVLIFEDGTDREWIHLSIGRNRWYKNYQDYVLDMNGRLVTVDYYLRRQTNNG